MDPMAAIKQTFFQECEEQLAELEAGLLAMEEGDTDLGDRQRRVPRRPLDQGRRRRVRLDELVRFAHVFETALDHGAVRAGWRRRPRPSRRMLRAADVLADLVRAARDGGSVDAERGGLDPPSELAALGRRDAAQSARRGDDRRTAASRAWTFSPSQLGDDPWTSRPRRQQQLHCPLQARIASSTPRPTRPRCCCASSAGSARCEVACDASALPLLADLDPEGAYLAWTIELETDAATRRPSARCSNSSTAIASSTIDADGSRPAGPLEMRRDSIASARRDRSDPTRRRRRCRRRRPPRQSRRRARSRQADARQGRGGRRRPTRPRPPSASISTASTG